MTISYLTCLFLNLTKLRVLKNFNDKYFENPKIYILKISLVSIHFKYTGFLVSYNKI